MNDPLVSVILAVKNGERHLEVAIESVLAQTYKTYEIILVDGNSTDKTANIAKAYPQIRYVRQNGTGISDAYNLGIDTGRGEFIAFLSYDDIWTPEKLSTQVNYLIKHPEIQFTVSRVKFFLDKRHSPPSGFRRELLLGDHVGKIMETLVARKDLFRLIGTFSNQFNVAEDVDWFARATDAKIPMSIIPEVLLYKRVHDSNLSINTLENNQNLLKILRSSIERKHHLGKK